MGNSSGALGATVVSGLVVGGVVVTAEKEGFTTSLSLFDPLSTDFPPRSTKAVKAPLLGKWTGGMCTGWIPLVCITGCATDTGLATG